MLTMKELEKWLTHQIVGHYHQTIHRSLLRPPIAVWRDWTTNFLSSCQWIVSGFWISFLPSEAAFCNVTASIFSTFGAGDPPSE